MAYKVKKYPFLNSNEFEFTYIGKNGAKGEERGKKEKATPEQMAAQNQWQRVKNVRRILKWNFKEDDLWCTLKHPRGTRLPLGVIKKEMRDFLGRMRKAYKKLGAVFKFVYRMEIGKRGGIHIHILVNRVNENHATDKLVKACWLYGSVYFTDIEEEGGMEGLAVYLVKQPDEEVEKQLSMFPEEDRKQLIKYSCSRNLVRMEPEVKEYGHWTMRKILDVAGEIKPTEGYYVDKSSIKQGINPYTGYSYLYYTEYRINKVPWEDVA